MAASGTASDRLESWKEIAAYLKRDERTLRRWEAREGLPVHRHGHARGASVYAYRSELEAWRDARDRGTVNLPGRRAPRRWIWAGACGSAVLIFGLWWLNPLPPPRLVNIRPITNSGRMDYLARQATDGTRIFYLERAGDHWNARETTFEGQSSAVGIFANFPSAAAAGRNVRVFDVSRDGTRLLIGVFDQRGGDMPLWTIPAAGGQATAVGGLRAGEAVFHPDGRHVVYSVGGNELWIAGEDGSDARIWVRLSGIPTNLAWSPDGTKLRLSVSGPARGYMAEVRADGSGLRPVLDEWAYSQDECCGAWTPDGRYFLFIAGQGEVWAERDKGSWRRSPRGPFRLSFGPNSFTQMVVNGNGKRAAFFGNVGGEELNRWDLKAQRADVYLPGLHAVTFEASRDGAWVAYSTYQGLWRADADGGNVRRLLPPGERVNFPRISPDGEQVAFSDSTSGLGRLATVAATGGEPRILPVNAYEAWDPDWSPDGRRLVASISQSAANDTDAGRVLAIFTPATTETAVLPNSVGLGLPRWSPDERYIAAVSYDQRQMRLYSFYSRQWKAIAQGVALSLPAWTRDGHSLYFQDLLGKNEPLYRYDLATGTTTQVAEFSSVLRTDIDRSGFMGLTENDEPVMSFNRGSNDLFAGDLLLP